MGFTMGMGVPLFMALWVLMMVAMMFPTAAPMILTFDRIAQGRKTQGRAFVPVWFFLISYLLVWTVFGIVAYLVATAADAVGARVMFIHENSARIAGAVLLVAGLYQLSPLKGVCLTKCRTPLDFLLESWREGYAGAFQMGVRHGVYCLGCCWLLFVLLFPLGVMNVAAMGVVTLLIFLEKSVRQGVWVGKAVGLALALFGVAVMALPALLPASL